MFAFDFNRASATTRTQSTTNMKSFVIHTFLAIAYATLLIACLAANGATAARIRGASVSSSSSDPLSDEDKIERQNYATTASGRKASPRLLQENPKSRFNGEISEAPSPVFVKGADWDPMTWRAGFEPSSSSDSKKKKGKGKKEGDKDKADKLKVAIEESIERKGSIEYEMPSTRRISFNEPFRRNHGRKRAAKLKAETEPLTPKQATGSVVGPPKEAIEKAANKKAATPSIPFPKKRPLK